MSAATVKISVQRPAIVTYFEKAQPSNQFGSVIMVIPPTDPKNPVFKVHGKAISRGDKVEVQFPNGYVETLPVQQDGHGQDPYVMVEFAGTTARVDLMREEILVKRVPNL